MSIKTFETQMLKSVKVFRCLRLDCNKYLDFAEINYCLIGFWPNKTFSHLILAYF